MPDTTTTHFGWTKPDPGGSAGTWDTKLNADLDEIDADLFAVSEVADGAESDAADAQATADDALEGQLEMTRGAVSVSGSSPNFSATIDLSTGGPVYTFAVASTSASADLDLTLTNRPVGYNRIIYLHITQTVSGLGNQLQPIIQSASKQWALPFDSDVSTSGVQGLDVITGNGQMVVPLMIVGS